MMRIIIFYLVGCLIITSAIAQKEKDKPVLVKFLNEAELLVVYNSGLNTVFNIPDLSVNREFSLNDKKNKTAFASLSPNGDRLIAFDSKVKKRIIWDVAKGEQVFTIESGYSSPNVFKGKTQYFIGVNVSLNVLSFKIYDIMTGESLGDLDHLEMPKSATRDITFSPSGNLLVNYNTSSLNTGKFIIYDYNKSEMLSTNGLGLDKNGFGLDAGTRNVIFNENEDSIKVVYRAHMGTEDYYSDFPVGDTDFEVENVMTQKFSRDVKKSGLSIDPIINGFNDGDDILIPMGKDYSFNYAKSDISPSKKWSVLHNNKGVILVFDHEDTEPIDRKGESFKNPKEITRITVNE